jgi:hypothetical protein
MPVALGRLTETIFPRIYARMYYAHPRARGMSFSHAADFLLLDTCVHLSIDLDFNSRIDLFVGPKIVGDSSRALQM